MTIYAVIPMSFDGVLHDVGDEINTDIDTATKLLNNGRASETKPVVAEPEPEPKAKAKSE